MRKGKGQERLPIVLELYRLGLTRLEIALGIGMSEESINHDVQVLGGAKAFASRPTKADDAYQACFKRYAELVQEREQFDDLDPTDTKVLAALAKRIGEDFILGYLEGVNAILEHFLTVECPPDKKGYLELLEAVLKLKLVDKPAPMDPALTWRGYLLEVASGEQPLPSSRSDATAACVHTAMSDHRREIMPIWTEEVFVQIDEQINTLASRSQEILRGLYALGQPRQSTQELAQGFKVTRSRAFALRQDALWKLSRLPTTHKLLRLASPVGNALAHSLAREAYERKLQELNHSPATEGWQNDIVPKLIKPVEELGLSVRALHALYNSSIECVGELILKTELDLLKTKNFGRKSVAEIKQVLSERFGLCLGMHIEPEFLAAIKELRQQGQRL